MIRQIQGIMGAGLVALCLLGAEPASALPVLWNIVETSCTPMTNTACKSGDAPLVLPITIGQVGGTGTYHSDGLGGFSKSGADFLAIFGGPNGNSVNVGAASGAFCLLGDIVCSLSITLTDLGDAGLAGSIHFENGLHTIDLTLGSTFTGRYSTDGTLLGCGYFTVCRIAGVETAVPEPSTIAMIAAALLLGFALRSRRTRPDI